MGLARLQLAYGNSSADLFCSQRYRLLKAYANVSMHACRVDVGILVAMVAIYRIAFWLTLTVKEKMR